MSGKKTTSDTSDTGKKKDYDPILQKFRKEICKDMTKASKAAEAKWQQGRNNQQGN